MDEFDSKDPLWAILGRTKSAQASPYFVRKVLRAIQEENSGQTISPWRSLLRWLAPVSLAASFIVAWAGLVLHEENQVRLAEFNSEFSEIADFTSLVPSEDISVWIAAASR